MEWVLFGLGAAVLQFGNLVFMFALVLSILALFKQPLRAEKTLRANRMGAIVAAVGLPAGWLLMQPGLSSLDDFFVQYSDTASAFAEFDRIAIALFATAGVALVLAIGLHAVIRRRGAAGPLFFVPDSARQTWGIVSVAVYTFLFGVLAGVAGSTTGLLIPTLTMADGASTAVATLALSQKAVTDRVEAAGPKGLVLTMDDLKHIQESVKGEIEADGTFLKMDKLDVAKDVLEKE